MNTNSKFDLWLVRISYIAQVGLFFLTTFTIYYTVIPIYQNASLQEAIAKKEVEYKELKNREAELYANLRVEYLKKISVSLIYDCSPTNVLMRQRSNKEMQKTHEEQIAELTAFFNKDIESCLMERAREIPYLKELRDVDKKKLLSNIGMISNDIKILHDKYEERLKDKDYLLKRGKEKSTHVAEVEKYLIANGLNSESSKVQLEQSYIRSGTYDVVVEYGFKINNIISEKIISY
ncbi:hypothetical protein FJP64_07675 [Kosakonia cowanii]|uniref:hypothetical protein n=1 Tax=Kosakonia cowanii TaxID=208223 RepID=UPI00111FBF0D|nr:hypothetical protein [Kosakonia cowanii]MDP9770460.1 hypothetical protein [Atlantibacter hermannii]TPD66555.1 hypothetical protein FJP70_09585 [Kosakonia cowanii]TPD90093.1 hypothetical protein FJP67_09590 [Kosakonia cowanii]TPE06015.1 hypothetical protein FJP64_07675 [Kosakonia cowanii]